MDYKIDVPGQQPELPYKYRQGVNRTPSGTDIFGNAIYDSQWIQPGFPGSPLPDGAPFTPVPTHQYSGRGNEVGQGGMWGSGRNALPPSPDVLPNGPDMNVVMMQGLQMLLQAIMNPRSSRTAQDTTLESAMGGQR